MACCGEIVAAACGGGHSYSVIWLPAEPPLKGTDGNGAVRHPARACAARVARVSRLEHSVFPALSRSGLELDSRPLTGAVTYWIFPVPAAVFRRAIPCSHSPNNATR